MIRNQNSRCKQHGNKTIDLKIRHGTLKWETEK